MSNKFPGDTSAAGPRTTLGEQPTLEKQSTVVVMGTQSMETLIYGD